MRPKNEAARAQVLEMLRKRPGTKAPELASATGLSQPTISRILKEYATTVIGAGRGPRRRYFARRELRGRRGSFPVYAVNASGQVEQASMLELVAPAGSLMDMTGWQWPVDAEFADGVWPGLPYPLQDMRPQGFLGRSFAENAYRELQVSNRPDDWSDDDVVHILSLRGADTAGNLIVGDAALQRWLDHKAGALDLIAERDLTARYLEMADKARSLGAQGSSAAGEFPKFTAIRSLNGCHTPHVIVKFSGDEESGTVRRWKDLLVCEHLAIQHARGMGLEAARTRVLDLAGRRMLEVERFDRHGPYGRSPLCTLETIDTSMIASASPVWTDIALQMGARGWISGKTERLVRRLWLYGQLLGNSDMHNGNLSFVPQSGTFKLAPVYDMLPMMYAPLGGGELPNVRYAPNLPLPALKEEWRLASTAALAFWDEAARDSRISDQFRDICSMNHTILMNVISKA